MIRSSVGAVPRCRAQKTGWKDKMATLVNAAECRRGEAATRPTQNRIASHKTRLRCRRRAPQEHIETATTPQGGVHCRKRWMAHAPPVPPAAAQTQQSNHAPAPHPQTRVPGHGTPLTRHGANRRSPRPVEANNRNRASPTSGAQRRTSRPSPTRCSEFLFCVAPRPREHRTKDPGCFRAKPTVPGHTSLLRCPHRPQGHSNRGIPDGSEFLALSFLTEVLAVDRAGHGKRVQHRQHPVPARRPPVVREPEVVVRPKVEHALRPVGQPFQVTDTVTVRVHGET